MKSMGIVCTVLFFMIVISAFPGAGVNNNAGASDNGTFFTIIFIDGANADSRVFKLLLRASERHAGVHFQPYVVDVDFILKDGEKIIFSEKVRQVSIGESITGSTEIIQPWHVALKEGKNYTASAEISLYEKGKTEYLTSTSASFDAIMDAAIIDIYGDSIGASATVKSESMVPLEARVVFTLKQEGRVLEVQEAQAPYLMSNDREKTVNVLWSKSLKPGEYIISSELRGSDVLARYDKAITVEKQIIPVPVATPTPAVSGFPAFIAIVALLLVILARRNKQ